MTKRTTIVIIRGMKFEFFKEGKKLTSYFGYKLLLFSKERVNLMSEGAKKISLAAMFSVASVWFTTHAGAGFATGNQGWNYFGIHGVPGMILPLVSMGILAWVIYEAMLMAQLLNTRNYGDVMKHLFKPYDKLYISFELFYYCIVLAAVGGVISASAGMVMETIPMDTLLATIIVGIVLLLLIIFGADLVRKVATILGVLIIVSGFSIYIIGFTSRIDYIGEAISVMYAPQGYMYPLLQAIIYCGFQCVSIPAMCACCEYLTTLKSLKISSFLGFLMNGFGVALAVWMLVGWKDVLFAAPAELGAFTLPNLFICEQLGIPILFHFYRLCLFACLISTGVSCIFGIVVRLENSFFQKSEGIMTNIMARRILITSLSILACMGISTFGLTQIVRVGYSYCGYLAIVCCVIPFLTIGRKKNREMLKSGNTGLIRE